MRSGYRTISLILLLGLLTFLGVHIYSTLDRGLELAESLGREDFFLLPENGDTTLKLEQFQDEILRLRWEFVGLLIGSFLILVLLYLILESRHIKLREAQMFSRDLNEKFNILLRYRNRLIILLDESGKVKEMNDAAEYFGLKKRLKNIHQPLWELPVFASLPKTVTAIKDALYELKSHNNSECESLVLIHPEEVRYCRIAMTAIRLEDQLKEIIVEVSPVDAQYRSALNARFLAALQSRDQNPIIPVEMLRKVAEMLISEHNYDRVELWEYPPNEKSQRENQSPALLRGSFPEGSFTSEEIPSVELMDWIFSREALVFRLGLAENVPAIPQNWKAFHEIHIEKFILVGDVRFAVVGLGQKNPMLNWDFEVISQRAQFTFEAVNRSQLWHSLVANLQKQETAEKLAGLGSFELNAETRTFSASSGMFTLLELPETFELNWEFFMGLFSEKSGKVIRQELVKLEGDRTRKYRDEHDLFLPEREEPMRVIFEAGFVSPDNEGVVISGVIVDITDEFMLRKRQEKLLEELQRSNQELEQFAYVASHDLQEPLRKIRAFGDLLTDQYREEDLPGLNYVERMQRSAGRMQTLIDDLLIFSRVSRDTGELEAVNLRKEVEMVLSDLSVAIEESGAKIEVGELPKMMGKSTQIRRLFQNLLSNAIKFRHPGVTPEIEVKFSRALPNDPALPPAIDKPATWMKITVSDNGIGFDMKYISKVFAIFQRLHGRNEYSGTGIGLAVCQKVVENHGGYLTAWSEAGNGARFYIYLPEKAFEF